MFLVKNLRASRVNLLMNDFAAGLPSPLAFLGLGAAIAPALGAPRWDRRPLATRRWEIAVLPVIHRVDVSEGRTKAELRNKAGTFTPIEIPEDLVGSVTVSLLLDIPDCTDEHLVAEALRGRRIAGGPINNSKIEVEAVTADGSALRRVDRGYAMIPTRPPRSVFVATGQIDKLMALAAELYIDPGAGWHVPVAVGHRLLEDPATAPKRENTRDPNIPHVFAEPVVGIAEFVSVRNKRLTELDEGGLSDLLWRWTAERDWIVGHPIYHPNRRVPA